MFSYPLDTDQFERHLAKANDEAPPRRCMVIPSSESGPTPRIVAYGELGAISTYHGSARLSRLIVSPEARGHGFGQQLVDALLRLAFEELQLRRVELEVYDFNASARHCYEKAGFAQEGTKREATRVGEEYWNSELMAVLRSEWRPLSFG